MSTTNNNGQEGQKEYHRLVHIPIAEVSGQEVKLEANRSPAEPPTYN